MDLDKQTDREMKLNKIIVILCIVLVCYNAYFLNIQAIMGWASALMANLTIMSFKRRYES